MELLCTACYDDELKGIRECEEMIRVEQYGKTQTELFNFLKEKWEYLNNKESKTGNEIGYQKALLFYMFSIKPSPLTR